MAMSDRVLTILDETRTVRSDTSEPFVFPGRKPKMPLSNMVFLMLLRRMGRGDLTAHGFRATFKTFASERTSFQNEIVEASLAHVIGDKVEQAYRRGDFVEKRRRLMGAWAKFCEQPNSTGKIIPISRTA
jgi:integrase